MREAALLAALAYAALVAYAYRPARRELPASALARSEDRFVDVDGLRFRYRTCGEPGPDRPTILLLHGFANSLQSFRDLAPSLSARFHVISVDMLGFGLSSKPVDHDYGNAAQAEWIAKFARRLGLESYVVAGHSLGGAVAEHVAVHAPEATGLVLLNPGILSTGTGPLAKLMYFPVPRLAARTFADRGFRARLLKKSYADPRVVTEQVIDDVMLGARSEGYLASMTAMMRQYEDGAAAALLSKLTVPTLIVWGALDSSKPADEATRLQSMIDGSRLVVIERAGHYVHEEAAKETAQAIIDDLPRLAGRDTLRRP